MPVDNRPQEEKLLGTLRRLYDLCLYASEDAFHNGVTDNTGTIDEGACHASDVLDEARRLLAEYDPPEPAAAAPALDP